jgi:glycosyltransferase domain-containing protein
VEVNQIDVLKNLSVVIPTFRRPEFIERAIRYWIQLPVKVFIVDGSDESMYRSGKLIPNTEIFYLHIPQGQKSVNENFHERWMIAASLPESTYSVICADDDFLSPSALVEVICLMNMNPEISAVVGHTVYYRNQESKDTIWSFEKKRRYSLAASQLNIEDRIFGSDLRLMYAVMRTSKFKRIFHLAHEKVYSHPHVAEFLVFELARMFCQTLTVNYVLSFRRSFQTSLPNFWATHELSFADWWKSSNNKPEVASVRNTLRNAIKECDPVASRLKISRLTKKFPTSSWLYPRRNLSKFSVILDLITKIIQKAPRSLYQICRQIVPASIRTILDSRREMSSTQGGPRLGVESGTLSQFIMSLRKSKILFDTTDFQRVQEASSVEI